jgi:hypothetical protein
MEYITANGTIYKCSKVTTGLDSISFTFIQENVSIDTIVEQFKTVTELSVSDDENNEQYGIYNNLEFKALSISANGNMTVTMFIRSNMEIRLENLEISQAEQDDVLAELIYGGR